MIVVTVEHGAGKTRRYVVAPEDEHLFDGVPDGPVPNDPSIVGRNPLMHETRAQRVNHLGSFYFGCQWLRGPGRIDECYRTLSTWEVTRVARR